MDKKQAKTKNDSNPALEVESQEGSGGLSTKAIVILQSRVITLIDQHLREKTEKNGVRYTLEMMAVDMGLPDRGAALLVAIRTGNRWLARMDQVFVRKLAKTLGLCTMALYEMCGYLRPEDCIVDDGDEMRVSVTYQKMRTDPTHQNIVPPEDVWASMTHEARVYFTIMYEHMTYRDALRYQEMERMQQSLEETKQANIKLSKALVEEQDLNRRAGVTPKLRLEGATTKSDAEV